MEGGIIEQGRNAGARQPEPGPYVVVVGSEKGGTGKSTTAIHLSVALMKMGFTVGTLDLDARQGSLTAFVKNRAAFAERSGQVLELPHHHVVERSNATVSEQAKAEEAQNLQNALDDLSDCDFVIIDTPGSDSSLCRLGHSHADTLVTPLNDSLLDVEVLARINPERREVEAPSVYSQLVWEQNNQRVVAGQAPIDWVVLRNRLAHIEARNMREISNLLSVLSKRIGFRVAPGVSERVVFRELFLSGLTALDLPADPGSSSHASARREINDLLDAIGLFETSPA
ncbi:AAA family ATPase [Pelagibius litoralis]|uniref:AAA family ATPase n=1 Tax=Pelagibius litoralis TaxID=374515 RepID=A0A967EXF2_9PROT|nr:division plane positioning ATPase MipZ [Pelagibius litoralis]NIA69191.1 AAA family ATPase [Pelagibius litoralis]